MPPNGGGINRFPLPHQLDKSTYFIIKTQNYQKANAEMVYYRMLELCAFYF